MNHKKIYQLLVAMSLILSACAANTAAADTILVAAQPAVSVETYEENDTEAQMVSTDAMQIDADYGADDLTAAVLNEDTTTIEFDGEMITIMGDGADLEGSVVTISSAGTYQLSGALNEGRLVVDTLDEGTVSLILYNTSITSSDNAPVYVMNADKTVITLADGTTNSLMDGITYIITDAESNEPNAAIFSNDDLTINGNGSLTVNANYKNGIVSNDDLKIVSGNITVNAAADGIKGKNIVVVSGGVVAVSAGNDGIQSYGSDKVENGSVLIEGGEINIVSGLDGIQAENTVDVSGGDINILAGGGFVNSTQTINQGPGQMDGQSMPQQQNIAATDETADSVKGIKGNLAILISDGIIVIDAADDTLHSNNSIVINNGFIQLSSGDDGIRAGTSVEFNGGEVTILTSVEGVESANITLNDGDLIINSNDDGINAISGEGVGGEEDDGSQFTINGGILQINAIGDGFDSNGDATINDGVVIINGPVSNREGSLDAKSSNMTKDFPSWPTVLISRNASLTP